MLRQRCGQASAPAHLASLRDPVFDGDCEARQSRYNIAPVEEMQDTQPVLRAR